MRDPHFPLALRVRFSIIYLSSTLSVRVIVKTRGYIKHVKDINISTRPASKTMFQGFRTSGSFMP